MWQTVGDWRTVAWKPKAPGTEHWVPRQVRRMGRMLRVLGAEAETEGGERLGLRPRAAGTWD